MHAAAETGTSAIIDHSLDVEIVLDHDHGLGVGKVRIGKVFERVGAIARSMTLHDLRRGTSV
jgi:hypothetical protein